MKTALIPGTFDPITAGHLDVIERSLQLFDSIVVGVSASPAKRGGPLFSLEERVGFIEEVLGANPSITVKPFNGLLVDFAVEVGAQAIVKGLRAVTDFESEFQQASLNYRLNSTLETLFIMATPENMYLSSSMVREVSSLGGNITGLVPPCVEAALHKKYENPSLHRELMC